MSKQAVQNVLDVFDDKVDPEVIIKKMFYREKNETTNFKRLLDKEKCH